VGVRWHRAWGRWGKVAEGTGEVGVRWHRAWGR
jgi:hypothetical protein